MSTKEAFLTLVRLGIGHGSSEDIGQVDWPAVEALAEEQGLSAVVLDGIDHLPEKKRPAQVLLLNWIGDTLQNYESRYEACKKAISEMATFYNAHGFKMMVLKGYVCSLDWPKPNHRPCGDIDIWLFGKQKEADALLSKEGVIIDKSHHHHTVFIWNDFVVENHFDFINVYQHKSNSEWERLFKELGKDDSHHVKLSGEKVYVPSPNLYALFLFKHLVLHFASESMSIRQLLDWAFFVKSNGNDVDWDMVEDTLSQYGLKEMYGIVNAICVGDLGFDAKLFSYVHFNPTLKDRVFHDVLCPEFNEKAPNNFVLRLFYRFKRWKANAWKHDLCYKESMWSAFWSGVWNHLLRPSSI